MKYSELLFLAYLKGEKKCYNLKEIQGLLGMTSYNFNDMVGFLLEEKYIYYSDYLLEITKKGELALKENYMNKFSFKIDFNNEKTNKPSLIEQELYIPKNFNKNK